MVLLWGQVAISLSISVWNGSVPAKISWWLRWVKIKLMRLSMEFIARQSNSSSSQPQIFCRRVFHAKHPSITDYGVCSDRSDGACKYYLCVFLTLASSRLDGANQTWRRAKHRNSTANEWHNTSHDAVTYSYANNLLAQDNFQRNDQRFWGTASNGQIWGGNANSSPAFTVAGQTGTIANGAGIFDATLGPRTTDAEVVFTGSLSLFGEGNSNIGSVLRWTDSNNWYKAYLDGTQLILLKRVAGTMTRLNAANFPALNGKEYTLRFRVVGSMLWARAWLTGQPEPAAWLTTANDTALPSGFAGLRVVIQNGVLVRIHMFTEMAAHN